MKEFDEDEIHHGLYLHLLWSTIDQKPLISESDIPHLYDYLRHVTLNEGCHLIGGSVFSDHVQLIIKFNPETIVSDLITNLKLSSLMWMRTNCAENKKFEWQKADFSFTVGLESVGEFIDRIKRTSSFKDEVFSLLNENEMEYDPVEVLE